MVHTGQGGRTNATSTIGPSVLRAGGGKEKQTRKKRILKMDFDSLDSEVSPIGRLSSLRLYWKDVNKIPGPNLEGGT